MEWSCFDVDVTILESTSKISITYQYFDTDIYKQLLSKCPMEIIRHGQHKLLCISQNNLKLSGPGGNMEETSAMTQCLDFTQQLINMRTSFKLELKLPSEFSLTSPPWTRNLPCPGQVLSRRNLHQLSAEMQPGSRSS